MCILHTSDRREAIGSFQGFSLRFQVHEDGPMLRLAGKRDAYAAAPAYLCGASAIAFLNEIEYLDV